MERCLLIHGFTGGEHEIAPLSHYLNSHHYETKTFFLNGLSGSKSELRRACRLEWVRKAEQEMLSLLQIHDKIHLIGFSTGALIAAHLSIKYPDRIHTLTLLSAPVFLLNSRALLATLRNKQMVKNYWLKFFATPFRATREFKRMVRESMYLFSNIRIPTLVVQGSIDHIVRIKSASHIYDNLAAQHKKLLIMEKAGHLLCYCKENSRLFREIQSFLAYH